MPYITRPGEPYPWFAGTSHALDQIIGIDQQGIRDQYDQLGEQRAQDRQIAGEGRANTEYDRRTGETRRYTQGQQAAERGRKGQANSLMLSTLQASGMLPKSPALDAATPDALGSMDIGPMIRELANQRIEQIKRERARMVAQAGGLEAGSPPTLTPEQDPAGGGLPHGYLPGKSGPEWLDPADPEAVMRIKDQRASREAANADRDARLRLAQDRLDLDTQRLELSAQKNEGRIPDAQRPAVVDALMRTHGFTKQQAEDHVLMVENKVMATSQVQPEANHVERDAARKNVDALRDIWEKAAGSQKNAEKVTAPQKKAAYEAAEAEFIKKYGKQSAPAGSTTGEDPLDAALKRRGLLR